MDHLKLNLGSGDYPLPGFANLCPPDWRFQDGLKYRRSQVDALTISHALMYVPLTDWRDVFSEFARVLKPHGVIRITEDATDDERCKWYPDGYPGDQTNGPAVTLTSRFLVAEHLAVAGFDVRTVAADKTHWKDRSLIQNRHGGEPHVFFIEGVRRPD